MTKLAVIVAAAENGTIGKNNMLPWHLPEDLGYFKRVTMGKPIIMGRKTFESIGRPLPGRVNIVISRSPDYKVNGVEVVESFDAALLVARDRALTQGVDELMVIGGEEIYRVALPCADLLYLTKVHADIDGDAHLPAIDWSQWSEVSCEHHQAIDTAQPDYSFTVHERRR